MAKKDPLTSPAGRALYPKLTEPDTKFKPEGEYSVKLLLTEAEAAPILKLCEDMQEQAALDEVKAQAEKGKKIKAEKIKRADLPVKPYEDPESGEETGEYVVTFKKKASGVSRKTGKSWSGKVALFDAKAKPIKGDNLQIWSGSVLKVSYSPEPFCTAIGAGVTLRLEAVQILELVSGGQRDASGYGFGAEENGYSHEAADDEAADSGDDDGGDAADTGESDF